MMSELEKVLYNLPKLMYELENGKLIVLGFQSQSMDNELGKLGINPIKEASRYFDEIIDLYKGKLDDKDYNKRLVYLYRKLKNLLEDYPADSRTSREQIYILSENDKVSVQNQVEIYKYIRSIYSIYN